MSILDLLKKLPPIGQPANNIVTANGKRLPEILGQQIQPVAAPSNYSPMVNVINEGDAPARTPYAWMGEDPPAAKTSWMDKLPPITVQNDPEINTGMRGNLPVITPAAPVAQPTAQPLNLPEIPIDTGRATTNNSIAANILPPIDESAAPRLKTALDANLEKYQQLQQNGAPEEHSAWKRLLRGLATGVANAPQGSGLGGILGAAAAGAGVNTFSKDAERGVRTQQDLGRLGGVINTQRAIRKDNQDMADAEILRKQKEAQTQAIINKPQEERESALRDFQYKMTLEEQKRQAEGGKYDVIVDGQGRQFRQYKNDPSKPLEPILDPETNEQLIDPSKLFYDVYSPAAGGNVKASGNTIVTTDATRDENNARRQQQTNETNARYEFEAQVKNVANTIDYNGKIAAQLDAIQKQGGQNIANLGEVNGFKNQIQTLNEQLQSISANPEFETSEDLKKQYNGVLKDFGKAQAKFEAALGKTNAGVEILNSLNARGIPKPQTVRAVKIQAVQSRSPQISRIGQMSEKDYVAKAKARGLSGNALNTAIAQAKRDGIIQ